jgi:NAD(P)-dependent dehydrogenase (short-subunit alcohol dehydrogenase family)
MPVRRTVPSHAGRRKDRRPHPPFPKQHQRRPGIESRLSPRPQFLAPDYRGAMKLHGRIALITGGDSGIGRAVAVLFAREGADIAICHLAAEAGDAAETSAAVAAEGRRCITLPGDLRQPGFAARAVRRVVKTFGRLDILVNNAGYQQHQDTPEDISHAQLERTFRTNVFGMFYMVQAALPYLRSGSAIINTGSITGLEGSKNLLDYSATKGAIHAFTKSLAQGLVDRGIRVNCVAPGPI